MRTFQHIIDTRSIKKVLSVIPDHWVIRELSERDYGIDLMVEIFNSCGRNKHNHEQFEASGAIIHIQVKGTSENLKVHADNTIHYSIDTGTLKYAEKFSTPMFLFRVDVSDIQDEIYFVWLQRYIYDVLYIEIPDWRERNTVTIRIPESNIFSKKKEKITRIAYRPKYTEELICYIETYKYIERELEYLANGDRNIDDGIINALKQKCRYLLRLKVFIEYNVLHMDESKIKNLLDHICHLDIDNCSEASSYQHKELFNLLTYTVSFHNDAENYCSDGETVY